MLPLLRADKNIALFGFNGLGGQAMMRFNHLHPPFDNVKARQAAMYAMAIEDLQRAQVGDPARYQVCNAPFICGAPYGKEYGDLLIKPDLDKARALLKESGYDGTPIIMMQATDLQSSNQLPPVGKQALEKVGFKVDLQAMDWQTLVSRRTKKDPIAQGGWSAFFTSWGSPDIMNPVSAAFINASCDKATFGWPCDEALEKLRDAFAKETDPAKQKAIAEQVSLRLSQAYPTFAPLGQFTVPTALRTNLSGLLQTPSLALWNVEKK